MLAFILNSLAMLFAWISDATIKHDVQALER